MYQRPPTLSLMRLGGVEYIVKHYQVLPWRRKILRLYMAAGMVGRGLLMK